MEGSPLARHASTPAELQARLALERRGASFLVLRDGDGAQRLFELDGMDGSVTVGRRLSCDVALHWDEDVSRLHARFERLDEEWTVVDDGTSHNGTWVNGDRVLGRRRLRDGDVLRFGSTVVAFRGGGGESRPTATAQRPRLVLTPVQRRVLVALCRPHANSDFAVPASNQQIADELHVSVDAVKAQLRLLFRVFGLDDLPQNQKRGALAGAALERGIVSLAEL